MPITPFLRGQAFDPEMVEAMGKAFVITCDGLNDRADAMTNLVAEKIIELGERGFKDPTAMYLAALNEFKSGPQ
jgi:elongation factor P hydroxylase